MGSAGIDLICAQDPNFTIPDDPEPRATWAFNGMELIPFAPSTVNLYDFLPASRERRGINAQLSVVNVNPAALQSTYVGTFECNLTSVHGQDSSSTVLGKVQGRVMGKAQGRVMGKAQGRVPGKAQGRVMCSQNVVSNNYS